MNKKLIAIIWASVAVVLALVISLVVILGNTNPPENEDNTDSYESAVVTDDGYARVPVNVTSNPGMIAAQVALTFDADVFEYVECENGKLFAEFQPNITDNQINCLLMADFSQNSDVTKTGTMFTVVLKVKEGAKSGKYSLKINSDKTSYANLNEEFVNPKVEIAKITIK